MIEQYEKELVDLKQRMEKAIKFSKVLPVFAAQIINEKLTGEEYTISFGNWYKKLHLGWGINRNTYTANKPMTNYRGEITGTLKLHSVYINTLSMYNSHEKFGLENIKDDVDVFYYDSLNSTFYATDAQIEKLLDAMVEWYHAAQPALIKFRKAEDIAALKKQLAALEDQP